MVEGKILGSPEQNNLMECLQTGQCTCVVRQGGEIRMMQDRGCLLYTSPSPRDP